MVVCTDVFMKPDYEGQGINSIFEWQLDDNASLPCCYSYKGFWIELSLVSEKTDSQTNTQKPSWQALIYQEPHKKTVYSVGLCASRIEAAFKAEQVITKFIE